VFVLQVPAAAVTRTTRGTPNLKPGPRRKDAMTPGKDVGLLAAACCARSYAACVAVKSKADKRGAI